MPHHHAPTSPAADQRGANVDIRRSVQALLSGARRAQVDPCAVLAVLALQEALGALTAARVASALGVHERTGKRHLAAYRAAWAASCDDGDRPVTQDGTPMAPDGGGKGGGLGGSVRPRDPEDPETQEDGPSGPGADEGRQTRRAAPRMKHPPEHVRAACAEHLRRNLRLDEDGVRHAMAHLTNRWGVYGGGVRDVLGWCVTVVATFAREQNLAPRSGRQALDELNRLEVCRACKRSVDPLYPEKHAACRP